MSRNIRVASVIWGTSILLSRVIGLVRESVIGRTLGNSSEADVYWAAFVLPDYLNYLLAGGALSLVFIPIFERHMRTGDAARAWSAFSMVANFLVASSTAATLILWAAAPAVLPLIFPGFDEAQQAELVTLVRVVLPAQVFHLVGSALSATLQARDLHALPALAPLVYTGSIVGAGLIWGPTHGAWAFAWGVLVGSALGPFGLPLVGALRSGLRWWPRLSLRNVDLRRYLWLSLPIMLGFSIVAVDEWIVKYHASSMAEGTLSRLQYARTLMKVPMGVFGLAAGVATFPTLVRLVGDGDRAGAYAALMGAARTMLVLAAMSQAALTAAGSDIAAVIWGRAHFTPDQLADIGLYTAVMCGGLWAWSTQGLMARAFYARQRSWPPTVLGTVVVIAALPLYALSAAAWDGVGLAAASSVAISAYVAVLAWGARRTLDGAVPGLIDALARLVPATAVGSAAGVGLRVVLPDGPALVTGALAASTAAVVCLAAAAAFRMAEVGTLLALLRGRLRQ